MEKTKLSTKDLALIALVTAITCILGPLALPIIFSPIPISLINLVLYISLYVLGTKKAVLSYLLYYFMGFIGLPVFSGFTGGLIKIAGPTGGYLLGFFIILIIGGLCIEKFKTNRVLQFIGLIAATIICYLFAAKWLSIQSNTTLSQAILVGVLPFLPGDIAKVLIAVTLGPVVKGLTQPFISAKI